jgi:uncharacterized GH25 family protein
MLALLAAPACSREESAIQTRSGDTPGTTATLAPAGNASAEITFKSNPETPKAGENTFEVTLMQDGKPMDDAQVSVEFLMAAMPQMNMTEMRNKVDLKGTGNGTYRGTGQVMMAGNWDVTVMAVRNGREIGVKKLTVTAK